jgi:hypothetical protein
MLSVQSVNSYSPAFRQNERNVQDVGYVDVSEEKSEIAQLKESAKNIKKEIDEFVKDGENKLPGGVKKACGVVSTIIEACLAGVFTGWGFKTLANKGLSSPLIKKTVNFISTKTAGVRSFVAGNASKLGQKVADSKLGQKVVQTCETVAEKRVPNAIINKIKGVAGKTKITSQKIVNSISWILGGSSTGAMLINAKNGKVQGAKLPEEERLELAA